MNAHQITTILAQLKSAADCAHARRNELHDRLNALRSDFQLASEAETAIDGVIATLQAELARLKAAEPPAPFIRDNVRI